MDYYKESLKMHVEHKGKMATLPKVQVKTKEDLSTAYTPGVAEPCRKINQNPENIYTYSSKGNSVAVVTDGSAVLGLGNIGADAAWPVMDGKCLLFKSFADIDAYPVCIKAQDPDEIVNIVANISTSYGGINLEDISAPRCFEIEKKLQEKLDIPVFHDDQHGTAIVVAAALLNALKVTDRSIDSIRVAIVGAGAAGQAITRMLAALGVTDITLCEKKGIVSTDRTDLNSSEMEIAEFTGCKKGGSLADALVGRDVFIGVSAPNLLTQDMIRSMNPDPIIFPMANPEPEIFPDQAFEAGAAVVGTGRSDYPNQINNVLAFPGIFKGALQARASRITEGMKVAAAKALASMVSPDELCADCIIPHAFKEGIVDAVAAAVAEAWAAEK